MTTSPSIRVKQAVSHIKKEIGETAALYELDSNAGMEALYSLLIADLGMTLARWRLRSYERSEKRRETMEG